MTSERGKDPVHQSLDSPVLDRTVIDTLEEDLGAELLVPLLGALFEDLDARSAALREAMASGDVDQSDRCFHAIKGASLNLGFLRIAEVCERLRALLAAGDAVAAQDYMTDFEMVFRDTMAALTGLTDEFERRGASDL